MATKAQLDLLRAILPESSVIQNAAVRRKAELGAIQAAIVESNISNPSGGDADSAGWRQERRSLYSNPTDVKASARRFFREFADQYDPGEKSYETTAQVQRPAAQYRGRYADVARRAQGILRQVEGGSSLSQTGSSTVNIPSAVVPAQVDTGSSLALIQALSQDKQKAAPVSAGIAPPSFSASPVLPQGAGQIATSGAPQKQGPDIGALLSAVASTRQSDATPAPAGQTVTVGGGGGGDSARPAGGGSTGGSIRFNTTKGGYQGSETVASELASIGHDLGLETMSTKRDNTNPYSGSRSDHDNSNQDAYAYDLSNGTKPTPEMDRAAFRIMRALGFKDYKMGQPINTSQGVAERGRYRIQVIYRGSGPEFGGNHTNHVHVGVKRVR